MVSRVRVQGEWYLSSDAMFRKQERETLENGQKKQNHFLTLVFRRMFGTWEF